MNITYKQLDWTNKSEWQAMVETICADLENKAFFLPYTEDEYKTMLSPDTGFVIGAFSGGGDLIGFCVMLITPDHCEMDGAMVLPEYRNQGIQTRMNELRIAHARQIGAKKIIVKIHPECVASIRACEKVGFVPGETKTMSSGVLRTIFELPLKAE